MATSQERQRNHAAYRQLCDTIKQNYAPGQFVAIAGGQIIADAAHFGDLHTLLHQKGNDSTDVLVVQAGVDYPETVVIFPTTSPCLSWGSLRQ
jgi:hypothetical protein